MSSATLTTPCKQALWVRQSRVGAGCLPSRCLQLLFVPRVSRLLADARAILRGPRARRMLVSLGKLMPKLRAARRASGEAFGRWDGALSLHLPGCEMGRGRGGAVL